MKGRACWPVMLIFAITGAALVRDLTITPYDDSYFFKRFALNFIQHGVFAWNVADGPVHGITSQLFQLVAVPLTWIARQHFVLASKLFLAGCVCACGGLLARESVRIARRDAAALLAAVVLCTPPVLATMQSGMETALALLLVTWSLGWVGSERARPGRAAAQTLLVYLCRPDAALIPALAFVIAHARDRARVLRYVALLLGGLAACLAALRAYYGTALPLPFYMKTFAFSPYGNAMVELTLADKRTYLVTFAALAAPLLYIAAQRIREPGAALIAAATAFVAYHAVTSNEIMGYRARFYLPALIPLAFAAALAWDGWTARHSPRAVAALGVTWIGLLALGYAGGYVDPARDGVREGTFPPRIAQLSDRAFIARSIAEVRSTRGLSDVARCLPGGAQIYHSEIGVPGLVLPDSRIVDLAGLMSKHIALDRPEFDDYCLVDRPEIIFLPHKSYAALDREIKQSRCIAGYVRAVKRSSSPMYVRADLAPSFLACATESARYR